MSLIAKANIKISDIPKEKIYNGEKGDYVSVTIVVNENLNDFGKQGPIFVSQSKEEREVKTPKHYLGDVEVVYNDLTNIATTKTLKDE